jgi:hypothetical protein
MIKKIFTLVIFSALTLNIRAQSPTITSFSPDSGSVGTLIKIIGTNLEKATAFKVGGVNAIVVSDTSVSVSNYGDTLVGLVMPGSATGTVSVTTAEGTATSNGDFKIKATSYPSAQQGSKLLGTGAKGDAEQGYSVSVSADGNTAVVGGSGDNSGAGATWVFTRSAGVWTQSGKKLIGTESTDAAQGASSSISADGNTIIIGGYFDNDGIGAAWVFTRSSGVWTQQGNKLVGTGAATGGAYQGISVSISADGNTALVGGFADSSNVGAAWIFTRSSGVWTQQGNKLVGTGALGQSPQQGWGVSISADGNTALVGGYGDNTGVGAIWIFTRSAGVWTQQGNKLIGSGASGNANQGYSVSISADGNTALVGGNGDNGGAGAVWIFTRSAGVWSQQGSKLIGTGAAGNSSQGYAVSISADGNTAVVGGSYDNTGAGATWIYTRSAGVWSQQGSKLSGSGEVGSAHQGISVSISADGNTTLVGGFEDNSNVGAAWVFDSSNPTTTGVNEITNIQDELAVYPNPSSYLINYSISSTLSESVKLNIFDMLGRNLLTETIQLTTGLNTFSKDISNFNGGIYFLRISKTDGSSTQKKFVVK